MKAVPQVLKAIDEADAIILGPGSLYTSVIPNLLVEEVAEHLKKSKAAVFYITNVMTEQGESDNYRASDHLKAVIDHLGEGVIDYCVLNNNFEVEPEVLERYQKEGSQIVKYDKENMNKMPVKVVAADLLKSTTVLRHDSQKLAKLVVETIYSDYRYYNKKHIWHKKTKLD